MIQTDDMTGKPDPESSEASPGLASLQRFLSSQIAPGQAGAESGEAVVSFRRFCAIPNSRQLLIDGTPVELGSRAFDLLITLIEARGRLVTKDEIMDRVWPSTVVSENNLRVQMAALRRALGNDRDVIKTIPGRGYFFAAESGIGSGEPWSLTDPHQESLTPNDQPSRMLAPIDLSHPRSSIASGMKSVSEDTQPAIVVIDDDPHIREALHGLLRSVGKHVEVFGSVEEFLSWARLSRGAGQGERAAACHFHERPRRRSDVCPGHESRRGGISDQAGSTSGHIERDRDGNPAGGAGAAVIPAAYRCTTGALYQSAAGVSKPLTLCEERDVRDVRR
jgi:DNA-binding winged helix-turn-helix (wHTH) protein